MARVRVCRDTRLYEGKIVKNIGYETIKNTLHLRGHPA